ncbi:hypothetical protein QFC19_000736 [Naganishia cerealis]|uniref:Uncharacterized protein n=1 Tax=Naganishia cerealis TaxID=610337 RepID=A0ACC2WMM1_9TREE|nr:hypothetical protein QFC19_000736 [Naganishia cerealis]
MAVQRLFAELQHVQQSTIDQWRTHGGRTTVSARTAKGDECVRLAPFIGLIDGFTGKPARISPTSTAGGSQASLVGESGDEVSSRWRLPVLVFCGKEDEGLGLKDEEYLGGPLEHDEACVILSEAWVMDSISGGRLLRMADYAKHGKMNVTRDAVSRGPVLQVLGSFKSEHDRYWGFSTIERILKLHTSLRQCPPLSLKHGEKQYGCPTVPHTAADSGRINGEAAKKCEEFQAEDARACFSLKRSCPWQIKLTGGTTSRYDTYDQSISQPSLESYIYIKKQDYISRMQADLDVWTKQKIEKADLVDEERIETALDECRDNMSELVEFRNGDRQKNVSADRYTNATFTDPAIIPLELEANTLLKLLPPLKRSHLQHSETNISANLPRSQYSNPISYIPYYPYLTPVSSDDSSKTARPPGSSDKTSLSNVQAQGHTDGIPPQTLHKGSPQKQVIAFHSAGYGLGWMDFEACGNWVCVAKKKRSG